MKESTTKSKPTQSNGSHTDHDVIQLLHQDHRKVKELFFQFSQAQKNSEKEQLVKTILKELFVHATLEEEIVYPAIRKEVDDSEDMMDEADTEHHCVKLLMAELSAMNASDDHFDSKVTVLGELVSHHVEEEEKEMFHEMHEAEMDLEELGAALMKRKEVLEKAELPTMKHPIKTSSRGNGKKN